MNLCSWPRGCKQDTPDGLCYYHEKVAAGYVAPDEWFFTSSALMPREPGRRGLVEMLRSLDAPQVAIEAVFGVSVNPPHHARHGRGYLPYGRVVA